MREVIAHRPDHPLKIGEIEIPCYVLGDETRVLSGRGVTGALAMQRGGSLSDGGAGGETAGFLARNWLEPYVHADLLLAAKSPIPFANPEGGGTVHGYPAAILPEICGAILEAHRQGATTKRQEAIVERASVLLRGLATVGIIALIDEATGYEKIRTEHSLARILDRFLSEELQPWVRTFPFEFYELLFDLNGWGVPPPNGKMPGIVGKLTVDLIYARLAPGVLEEVMARTPRLPGGELKWRLHRWFTPEFGHPKVREQIRMAIAFMKTSETWNRFLAKYNYVCPVYHEDTGQLTLRLEESSRQSGLF